MLRGVLECTGHGDEAVAIYDFPMALESGVSSIAGQALIELGLSRIAALELEKRIPDSSPTAERVRQWSAGVDVSAINVPAILKEELLRKLVQTAEG